MVPRENKSNAFAKFGGTKSITVFSEMAYSYLIFGDFLTIVSKLEKTGQLLQVSIH